MAKDLGKFGKASVDRIRVTIAKDGSAWAGIDSVTFVFENPDRETQFERSAIAEDADAGIWYYDTVTTDLTEAGTWTLGVRVVDGAITKRYPEEISFRVQDEP